MGRRLAAGLMVLLLATAAGCSRGSLGGRPVDGGVLRVALTQTPGRVLNPLLVGDSDLTRLIYGQLLKQGAQLEPVCDLCERYSVSPDQRTVTFVLRQGVQWHDGKPFSAEDVAFTLRTLLHPDYAGPRAGTLSALAGVQPLLDQRDSLAREVAAGRLTAGAAAERNRAAFEQWLKGPGARAIATPDAQTVVLRLDQPYGPLLAHLMVPVLPAHSFSQVAVAAMREHEASRRSVGTGPFKLVEYRPGQLARLERNDTYYGGKPHIATVEMKVVKPAEFAGALQRGEFDYAQVPASAVGSLAGEKQVRLVERMGFGYQYVGLNHDLPALADRRVRQALLLAINRDRLVSEVLNGHGTVLNGPLAVFPWVQEGVTPAPYGYDPGRAAALLADAGWHERNKDGWLVKDGQVLGFTVKVPHGQKARETTAALLAEDLKAVGVRVRIEPVEFAQLVREVFGERSAEAWLLGWDVAPDPDPGPAYRGDNKWGKATGWANARSEALQRQAVQTVETGLRRPLYTEWNELVAQELPVLYLYTENQVEAINVERVQGARPDPRGLLWNIEAWWIAGGDASAT
jgi:peptide/nickel transport system substrate-binding protein